MDELEIMLRATFLEEATQLLQDCEQSFLALEASPQDSKIIDRIFRLAHSLKGSSKAVNFNELAAFTHEFESLLLRIKNKEMGVSSQIVDVLLKSNDLLTVWIGLLKENPFASVDSSDLLQEFRVLKGETVVQTAPSSGFVIFDEEAAPEKAAAAPLAAPSPAALREAPKEAPSRDDSLRVSLSRVDSLVNDVGELVILQTVLKQQRHLLESPLLQQTIDQLTKITRSIQDSSMRLRMVTMQQTFNKMQRIVRDTSKSLGKDVALHLAGEESEVDKTVVDKLGDPLVHLIRNAIDHGLDFPEERLTAGKPAQGNVWLSAQHQGGRLVIEVRDDGRGLNSAAIKKRAIERGLIAADAEISEEAIHQLIFAPGFSTKNEVTDLSGRGVGLDVVKTNIAELKGELQLATKLGEGTTFRIVLPLTLAIVDGIVLRLSNTERYVVPLSQVHEIIELDASQIANLGHGEQMIKVRARSIPLFCLDRVFERPEAGRGRRGVIVVSRLNQRDYGFLAECIIGQQQVVIKQLGKDIKKIAGISGSAILGDGKAALIVDLEEIVKSQAA